MFALSWAKRSVVLQMPPSVVHFVLSTSSQLINMKVFFFSELGMEGMLSKLSTTERNPQPMKVFLFLKYNLFF